MWIHENSKTHNCVIDKRSGSHRTVGVMDSFLFCLLPFVALQGSLTLYCIKFSDAKFCFQGYICVVLDWWRLMRRWRSYQHFQWFCLGWWQYQVGNIVSDHFCHDIKTYTLKVSSFLYVLLPFLQQSYIIQIRHYIFIPLNFNILRHLVLKLQVWKYCLHFICKNKTIA